MTDRPPLTGQLLVRTPAAVAEHVRGLAAREGITAAAWCRRHICIAAGTPAAAAVPVKAYRAPLAPVPEHVLEVARLRESVAELCGALVKAAIHSREAGRLDTHAEIEVALPGVRAAVRDLDQLKIAMLGDR